MLYTNNDIKDALTNMLYVIADDLLSYGIGDSIDDNVKMILNDTTSLTAYFVNESATSSNPEIEREMILNLSIFTCLLSNYKGEDLI